MSSTTGIVPTFPLPRHSLVQDIQGILFGSVMMACGALLLQSAGLITGQLAGLSLLASRATSLPFGWLFFAMSMPFYAFAVLKRGWNFTLRTVLAVTAISTLLLLLPPLLPFHGLNPWAAGILAACCCGTGLISLFRHGASAGGIGILALYVQDKTGFRAGWLQLIFDAGVFGLGALLLDPNQWVASTLSAILVNLLIAANHSTDRYVALSI